MRLWEAVQSLTILELPAVSWIHIVPLDEQIMAVFRIELRLPFADPAVPEELRTGPARMWPDQKRILVSDVPIEDQIKELHMTGLLGNLAWVYRVATEGESAGRWIIETHAGTREERLAWIRLVIEMEGWFAGDDAQDLTVS
jgi:hypothetical protein